MNKAALRREPHKAQAEKNTTHSSYAKILLKMGYTKPSSVGHYKSYSLISCIESKFKQINGLVSI